MEVILEWAASGGRFGLVPMDDVSDNDLNDIEEEQRESKSRVGVKEMWDTVSSDDGNPESEANEDDGTGKNGLDSLMSLEPSASRGPKVSSD